jgi:hypothetical protein
MNVGMMKPAISNWNRDAVKTVASLAGVVFEGGTRHRKSLAGTCDISGKRYPAREVSA